MIKGLKLETCFPGSAGASSTDVVSHVDALQLEVQNAPDWSTMEFVLLKFRLFMTTFVCARSLEILKGASCLNRSIQDGPTMRKE